MTVAVICDVLGEANNGTTIAAMNLINALRSRGHTVRVVCPDEEKQGEPDWYIVPRYHFGPLRKYVEKNGVAPARVDQAVLEAAISDADMLIVGGTSLVVYPAAGLIRFFRGDTRVLINKGETGMDTGADLVITDPIGQVLSQIRV